MADHTGIQRIHGYCGFCIARCGTIATVENGLFTRLDPDPAHPTGHAICAKGRAAPELVYHPERLTCPLRRTGPKGDADARWQRIGWDDALDLTAAAMRRVADRHGPQAVAFTLASGSTTSIGDAAVSSSGWRTRSARRTRRIPSTSAAGDAPSPPSTPTVSAASALAAVAPCRTSRTAAC